MIKVLFYRLAMKFLFITVITAR